MDFFERHADKIVAVSESGCWIWTGSAVPAGYGKVWMGRITAAGHCVPENAHRAAYLSANGGIPDGAVVRHICDVPCCVNPAHLVAGTQAENIADKASRGRQPRGSAVYSSKLTERHVLEIRKLYAAGGVTTTALAERFGVSQTTIWAAIKGRTWRHI